MSEHDRSKGPEAAAGTPESASGQGSSASPQQSRALRHRAQVQRKAKGASAGAAKVPGGGGSPLSENVRAQVEPRLGADLSGVRIHTGSDSAKAAQDFGARAFTVGNDVHFNSGEFAPGQREGDRLLVHELTHVVQGQSGGIQRKAEEEAPAGDEAAGEAPAAKAGGVEAAGHGSPELAAAHDAADQADGGAAKQAQAQGGAGDGGAAPTVEAVPASNAAEEAAAHAEGAVSQPGDPAEKEADKVADHVTAEMHGEPQAGGGGGAATTEQAPKIGAKLQGIARKPTPGGAAPRPGGGPSPTQDFQDQEIAAYSAALQRIAAEPLKADPKALLRTRDRAFELAQKSVSPKGQALRGLALMACDKVDTEWARLIQLRIGAPLGAVNLKDPQIGANLDKIARAIESMATLVSGATHLPQSMSAVQAIQTQLGQKRVQSEAMKAKPVAPTTVQPHAPVAQPQVPVAPKLPPPPAPTQPQAPMAGKLPPPPAPPMAGKLPPPAPAQPEAHAPPQAPQEAPIDTFANALNAGDPKARELWNQVPAKDRGQVTPSEMAKALALNPELGVEVMRDTGTTFSKHPEFAKQILNSPNAAAFVQPLDQANLVNDLINAPPLLHNVTNKEAQSLARFFPVAPARRLFEKVYPALQDGTYDAAFLRTGVWAAGEIEKLFGILAKWAPVGHVHASSEGFWQVTEVAWKKDGKWEPAKFAWQHGRKMVLPKTGGGDYAPFADAQGHNMTGGQGASALGKAKQAEDKKPGPAMGHFEGSVLHEVGHAVANAVGGNAWSMSRNNFEKLDMATWAKALLPDSADKKFKSGLIFKKLKEGAVSAQDARMYIASRMNGGTWYPPGMDRTAATTFIEENYADQPLYHYWKSLEKKEEDFKIPDANLVGGKAYAKLSRFNNAFCRYDAKTFQNRVSWYSVASPAEWFAEQYAHYYRTGGQGLEGDVKQKMDEIAKLKFDPGQQGKDGDQGALSGGGADGAQPASSGGKIKPEEAEGEGGTGAADQKKNSKPPEDIQRLAFPW